MPRIVPLSRLSLLLAVLAAFFRKRDSVLSVPDSNCLAVRPNRYKFGFSCRCTNNMCSYGSKNKLLIRTFGPPRGSAIYVINFIRYDCLATDWTSFEIKLIASSSGCLFYRKRFCSFRTGLEPAISTVETIKVRLQLPMHQPQVLLR